MKRFSDWRNVRAEYERGERVRDLMQKFGVTRRAIELRRKAEQWRKPDRMVAGNGHTGDQNVRPIIDGFNLPYVHQWDWQQAQPVVDRALKAAKHEEPEIALKFAKLARTIVETLRIIHQGECESWGIGKDAPPAWAEVSDSELEAAISEASERIARQRRDGGDHTLH